MVFQKKNVTFPLMRLKRDNLFQECSQMPASEFAIVRHHKLGETLEKG